MNRKNYHNYFWTAIFIFLGCLAFTGTAHAECLYQGTNCYEGLTSCTAECKQFGCTAGVEEPVPLNGCAGSGFTCCKKISNVSIPPPSGDCLGFCVSEDVCKPGSNPGSIKTPGNPGTCNDGLYCCGQLLDSKDTVTPQGGASGTQTNGTQGTPDKYNSFSNKTCSAGGYSFPCPLGPSADIPGRIGSLVNMVLGLVGALFFAMFIWGGVLYMTSGTSKRTQEGTQTLVNAVIGLIIVAFSYIIVERVIAWLGSAGV